MKQYCKNCHDMISFDLATMLTEGPQKCAQGSVEAIKAGLCKSCYDSKTKGA